MIPSFSARRTFAEFWNVATRPTAMNGLGLSTEEVLKEIGSIENLLALLPDIPGIYPEWKRIVAFHGVQGVKVYDARLVAVMNLYSIATILSFNTEDFRRYANITALHPSATLT